MADWIVDGVVDSLDADQRQITIWLEGFQELQVVPIAPNMPEWLLKPDVAFRTTIPRQAIRDGSVVGVQFGDFTLQPYADCTEEELFDMLTDLFYGKEAAPAE